MATDFPPIVTDVTISAVKNELAPLPVNNHDQFYVHPASAGPITAVRDYCTVTIADCKDHVDHPTSDETLDRWFDRALRAAVQEADKYCQNPFTIVGGSGGDGAVEIPAAVELWVLDYVGRHYEVYANGLTSKSVAGVEKQVFGEENFRPLARYRKIPGF